MQAPDPLVLDLVEWVAREPRPYAGVIDAWRTSCPRLTIWEDAVDFGYLERATAGDRLWVIVTPLGMRLLADHSRNACNAGFPTLVEAKRRHGVSS